MEEGNSQRKIKHKHVDTDATQGIGSAIAPPEVPQELSDKLTKLIQDLLLKAHELSFEYSTMDCDEILECPLAKKAKELFRIIKSLSDMSKKMATPPKT